MSELLWQDARIWKTFWWYLFLNGNGLLFFINLSLICLKGNYWSSCCVWYMLSKYWTRLPRRGLRLPRQCPPCLIYIFATFGSFSRPLWEIFFILNLLFVNVMANWFSVSLHLYVAVTNRYLEISKMRHFVILPYCPLPKNITLPHADPQNYYICKRRPSKLLHCQMQALKIITLPHADPQNYYIVTCRPSKLLHCHMQTLIIII